MPLPDGVFRVVKPSGKVYWYHQKDRGKPTRGPLTRLPDPGTPEWHQEIARLCGAPEEAPGSMAALIVALKDAPNWKALRPNSRALYQSALDAVEAAWGDLPAARLEPRHVAALLAAWSDRPSMGNQILVQVRALMKLAVLKGIRKDNPAREIDKLPEVEDGAKPLTPEAWVALRSSAAPEALRRLAVIGRATGQRLGDLLAMRPLDRDGAGISCTIAKLRDRPHWCPLTPAEIAEIDGWKQFPASPYVMRHDGRRHDQKSLQRAWRDYAATEAGAALAGFTPHDLRATKVCDDRIKGHSHQEISSRVGMSLAMVMRYSRHIDQRLAAEASTKKERRQKTGSNRPENPKGK